MNGQFVRRPIALLIFSLLYCATVAQAGSPLEAGAECGEMSRADRTCMLSRPAPQYTPMLASTSADAELDACVTKLREQRPAQTLAACQAYIAADRGTPRQVATAMFYLGHAYTFSGKMKDATSIWGGAINTDPSYPEPYLYLGLWAAGSDDPLSALPYYDSLLRIDPENAQARTGRARAYLAADRPAEALKESEMAIGLDPTDPIARQMQGTILERSGHFIEAAAEYSAATEGYDFLKGRLIGLFQDRNPWLEMARALDRGGKPREAAAAIDSFLATLPAESAGPDIYLARAEYREHAGNNAGAAEDIAKAVGYTRDEEEAAALNFRRAILLQKAGSADQALSEMEAVLRKGDVQTVLRIQVVLKNAGHSIEINGTYDEPTREALADCFADPECSVILGKKS